MHNFELLHVFLPYLIFLPRPKKRVDRRVGDGGDSDER